MKDILSELMVRVVHQECPQAINFDGCCMLTTRFAGHGQLPESGVNVIPPQCRAACCGSMKLAVVRKPRFRIKLPRGGGDNCLVGEQFLAAVRSGGKYHTAVRCPSFQPGSKIIDVAFVAACGQFPEGNALGRWYKRKGVTYGVAQLVRKKVVKLNELTSEDAVGETARDGERRADG